MDSQELNKERNGASEREKERGKGEKEREK